MNPINKDTLAGSFAELKGKAMKQWGKLTDNDFTEFKGNLQELKGKIQKAYGYSAEKAEEELSLFAKKGTHAVNGGLEKVNDSLERTKKPESKI